MASFRPLISARSSKIGPPGLAKIIVKVGPLRSPLSQPIKGSREWLQVLVGGPSPVGSGAALGPASTRFSSWADQSSIAIDYTLITPSNYVCNASRKASVGQRRRCSTGGFLVLLPWVGVLGAVEQLLGATVCPRQPPFGAEQAESYIHISTLQSARDQ